MEFFNKIDISDLWPLLLVIYPFFKKIIQWASTSNQCNYCPQKASLRLKTTTGPLFFCEGCSKIHRGIIQWAEKQNEEALEEIEEEDDDDD